MLDGTDGDGTLTPASQQTSAHQCILTSLEDLLCGNVRLDLDILFGVSQLQTVCALNSLSSVHRFCRAEYVSAEDAPWADCWVGESLLQWLE
jgi:hypothetical protein